MRSSPVRTSWRSKDTGVPDLLVEVAKGLGSDAVALLLLEPLSSLGKEGGPVGPYPLRAGVVGDTVFGRCLHGMRGREVAPGRWRRQERVPRPAGMFAQRRASRRAGRPPYWLGVIRQQVIRTLGAPSGTRGDWLVFLYKGKAREVHKDLTEVNALEVRVVDGHVIALRASKITSD